MLDKLLNAAVKRFGLNKYIHSLTLDETNTRPYYLVLGSKTKSVKVWFDVQPEYKDEVELVLNLMS